MSTDKKGRGRPTKPPVERVRGRKTPLARTVESVLAAAPDRISRAELARRCGWTSQNLYRILACPLDNIQVSTLTRLAKELGVSVDWLLAKASEFADEPEHTGGVA